MLNFLLRNDFLSTIFAFVLVLIPAVIVHELGHFFAAKAAGITVLEFGIGFPPRILRLFRWGETEFTLNWIPLGGFVRPLGEDLIRPLAEDAVERDRQSLTSRLLKDTVSHPMELDAAKPEQPSEPYKDEIAALQERGVSKFLTVNEAKPLPRIVFLAAGALANFASAIVLFVAVGLIGIPQIVGGTVELVQVPPDSPFTAIGLQSGDLVEKVNGETFTNNSDLFERLDQLAGQSATLTVLRPATGREFEVQFKPSANIGKTNSETYVRVLGVTTNSPAHLAGLRPNDLISSFDGNPLADANDPTGEIVQLTEEHAGQEVTLSVLRDGKPLTFTLTPRLNRSPDEGRIGIVISAAYRDTTSGLIYAAGPEQQATIPLSFSDSIRYSADQTTSVLAMIAEVPGRLIKGTITPEEARPISIIGISQVGAQALQQSIQDSQPATILRFIGIINILLGLTNLLPLPALDGGRIAFVLLEIVRGRPISPEREGMIHLIGLVFILSIGVLFMLNDLINPLPNILR